VAGGQVERTKPETLAWLRKISGELATTTLKRLEDTLPWYRDMPPGRRSAVGLVAQAGISSFISWYDDPRSTPWIAADVFGAAPRELLRSVSLQQTLQLIKITVEVVEERVKTAGSEDLREAILLYSREIAFAAADVYARAAEARGLWDARLEALVVDSILTGEYDDELPSRIAALGWHGHGEVSVLVGTAPKMLDVDQLRRDGLAAEEHNFLYPQQEKQVPYVTRKLQEAEGPFVAVTDYSLAVPDMIRQFVPGEYATLGADSFGFSDTRPAARRFFKIDGPSMVVRTLELLAAQGKVDPNAPAWAIEKYLLHDVNAGTTGSAGGEA
jgi:hypothetical protein